MRHTHGQDAHVTYLVVKERVALFLVRLEEGVGVEVLGGFPFQAEVVVGSPGGAAALLGAGDEGVLEQIGFDDVDEGFGFLAHGGGDGLDAGGAAVVDLDQGADEQAVLFVEAAVVDALEFQGFPCDVDGQVALGFDGGEVAGAAEEAVGDARGAAASLGEFPERLVFVLEVEELGVLAEELVERLRGVELDVVDDAEAGAHGASQ